MKKFLFTMMLMGGAMTMLVSEVEAKLDQRSSKDSCPGLHRSVEFFQTIKWTRWLDFSRHSATLIGFIQLVSNAKLNTAHVLHER